MEYQVVNENNPLDIGFVQMHELKIKKQNKKIS